jgi:hypothetical protein
MPRNPLRALRTTLVLAGVAVWLAAAATVAVAAPTVPTMGLAELEAKLAASPSGTLTGHFDTVFKGATVEPVPVTLTAIVANGAGSGPENSLIMFEATGPQMAKLSGIAQGMSGSPVYVNDNGVDKLVGALSYGDSFTLAGTGLATPIDAMSAIETRASRASASGLDSFGRLYIGGVNPRSALYRAFTKRLSDRGVAVVPLATGLGAANPAFSENFKAGGGIAALLTRGDMWFGGIGTVTYVNGNNVLAFGHPMFWEGDSTYYLCNAWIDGVWPSTYVPYKLGRPGAVRGTITQDRQTGIMGVVGNGPAEMLVTSSARNPRNGDVTTGMVGIPSAIADSGSMKWYGILPMASSVAGGKLYDAETLAGSAQTTTTFVLSSGTETFTITRTNMFDDGYDIGSAVTRDVDFIGLSSALFNEGGYAERAHIVSVDLQSSISTSHASAVITGVDAPNGLRVGDNKVRVSLRQYGVAATRTIDVTLTIPAGTPLGGSINAKSINSIDSDYEDYGDYELDYIPTATEATTVSELVKQIKAEPTNNTLIVTYDPEGSDAADILAPAGPVETSVITPWYLSRSSTRSTPLLTTDTTTSTVSYGGSKNVSGMVLGADSGILEVYKRATGETTESLVATVALTAGLDTTSFSVDVTGLTHNSVIRVVVPAGATTILTDQTLVVNVRARISLKATKSGTKTKLTATLAPADVTGQVVFERLSGHTWKRIATADIAAAGASTTFTAPKGSTKVRARFLGSDANAASTSKTVTVKVK